MTPLTNRAVGRPTHAGLAHDAALGLARLAEDDPLLHDLLSAEHERQSATLCLLAASAVADPSVLSCLAATAGNVTAEGFPGARFHAGAAVVDQIEELAAARARAVFGARYANVQPHSGTSANQIVLFSLLRPGDTLLGMDLMAGGHLSHGAAASVTGRYARSVSYGVGSDGLLDYDAVRERARETRPRVIVCGASSYPRTLDFARFRAIADEVGAVLLADISHIAGLVAAGLHPSPVEAAHVTTTSLYKQLYGPRGGLIVSGPDADLPAPGAAVPLGQALQRATFPFYQGTPNFAAIAAKACALGRVRTRGFRRVARAIVEDARALAGAFARRGYRIVTGGTDTHMVLLDLSELGITGAQAERALERSGIVTNRNQVPGDRHRATVASGLRLGTNTVALLGMGVPEMELCAELIDRVLAEILRGDPETGPPAATRETVRAAVRDLLARFPHRPWSMAAAEETDDGR